MNTFSFKLLARFNGLVLLWLMGINACFGQVAVTVSPSITSNTFPGFLTLNITGLTNTEEVIIQRWFDANGNGAVDPGEPLMESFKLQDGGAMVVGGITNVSVPYDSNSATGAITTTLNFGPPLTLMDIVGQQVYRVVSPSSRFAPVTATLTVTNAALSQSLNGVVYSNGVAGLSHAFVVALALPNYNYAGAVEASGSGKYHLALPAGQYALLGLLPGYYVDQSLAPIVTLTNGVSATNNMSATNSTGPIIAGQFYDAGNSNTLGGVALQLTQSGGNLLTFAFADTNGNFSAPVTSNLWKIKVDSTQFARQAYVVPENAIATIDTSLGSVTNANFGLLKGNALYYGRLTDNTGAPLINYDVGANDNVNQFKADGLTDANGNYGVAVVNTTNLPWFIAPSGDNSQLINDIITSQQNFIATNILSAINNFHTLPITAQISGHLRNRSGQPLAGIGLSASSVIGTNNFNTAYVDTDTNGFYAFGAANGTWYVFANANGNQSLASAGYYDPSPNHPITIPPTNVVVNISVYPANLPTLGQATRISATQLNFNLYGAAGDNYTIQIATNLAATNWFTAGTVSNLPSSPFLLQDFSATNTIRFYRAFESP